ncbi:hypothetical protein [Jatrophihabitans endophyticus]|uniref:hypothetical protein n=1 Tax=Jatrophihabitans endophyticus TaxID=1206085 RepID=UPI0013566CB4|nr:hypothetical protein [Jatrophihabitans endophyticus]
MTVVAVLLAGCTGGKGGDASSTTSLSPPTPAAAVARTGATAVGSTQRVAIEPTRITASQRTSLKAGAGRTGTLYVGQPVELSTPAPIPRGGIRLTRRYATAVPAGLAASFVYWDTSLRGWHAVPSTLSGNRRVVTAVVHHLSVWTDVVGSVTGAVGGAAHGALAAVRHFGSKAADWAYYEVGKVFDTRVDPPTCTSTPSWVSSTTFIDTARNNSLLFCVGHDPKNPDLLVVKARVNRGFAFTAKVGADHSWQYNSTSGSSPLADARAALGHLDDALSRTLDGLSPPGQVLVGAGKELDLGFSADQVRNADVGSAVVTFAPPTVDRFLISLVGSLIGDAISDAQQGYTAGAIALAGCYDDVHDARGVDGFARAAQTCLSSLDTSAASALGNYLRVRRGLSDREAGRLAGRLVARVSVYLALVGPVFSTMNFAAEQTLPASARTVTVFPTIEKVTASTLRTAQVPAYCRLPAQRLVAGHTTKGHPGSGDIAVTGALVGRADFAGAGYQQILTVYGCNAGGVGWPQQLLLVGAGGTMLGHYELGKYDRQEHSNLTSLTVAGHSADITWDSYEGAGFYVVHHGATVRYTGGTLVLDDEVDRYTPAKVVDDILMAQDARKRSTLRDPDVVTDVQWNALVHTYRDDDFLLDDPNDDCRTAGDTAVCRGTWYDRITASDDRPFTMTLVRSTGGYGWKLADLRLD